MSPLDRARWVGISLALLAIYGAVLVLDGVARAVGRRPIVDRDGLYPWEREG